VAQRLRLTCSDLAGILDREIFASLKPGERSDIYKGSSKILRVGYGEHWIYFFYLNVGQEIVRLEFPQWVARDEEKLNLLHALVYDQCKRGRGYPSALQEAHEQAVITGPERRVVESLVEEALAREGVVLARSGKATSKKERGV
jgi:NurA-like 5'-3' nuclease